jgi:tRNA modification GTPase
LVPTPNQRFLRSDPSPNPLPQGEGGEFYATAGAYPDAYGVKPGHDENAPPTLRITNKIDLGGAVPPGAIGISVHTGAGMDDLRARLATEARAMTDTAGPPPLTRARHRAALQEAAGCLTRAAEAELPELRAEDLRLGLRALGRITGQIGVEDLLDTIFLHFCIGK